MSRKPDVWMPFFVGDYLGDTAHLTTEQHGAYLLMLLAAWKRCGSLPNDEAQLAAITRLNPARWRAHAAVLLPFFKADGDALVQGRLAEEYEKAVVANEAQRENGKKGGRPRKGKPNESQQKPTGFDWLNPRPNPTESPSPSTSPEATKTEPSGDSAPSAAGGERTGYFEGHPSPVATPNPVAAYAIALSRAGFQCTSLNPDLVAYVQAGGTVEHLLQCAALPDCRGKKAAYPIRIAMRELTEPARPPGDAQASPAKTLSKTAQAFLTLEGMKSENRLDSRRSAEGAAEVAVLITGSHSGKRIAADHGGDVG